MRQLDQNVAFNAMIKMVSSTDHTTELAGLTLTITISKNGGAFAASSITITDRGNGWYNVAGTTAESDTLGDLVIRATATGADPGERVFFVVVPRATAAAVDDVPTNAEFNARTLPTASYATAAAQATLQTAIDDVPTNAEFNARTIVSANYSTLTAAQVNTEADQALADAKAGYAAAIEAAILNEGDATALLAAIAAKVEDFLINEGDSRATLAAISAAVWSHATRVLTAGTNIVLAKGVGLTGLNDLSAAQVNAEADQALADYDPPTKAEVDAAIGGISSGGDATLANQILILDWFESDWLIDKSTTPWTHVTRRKITNEELVRKKLKTADGADITSETARIGQMVN